jgi:predicted transcriptional regulator YdeE
MNPVLEEVGAKTIAGMSLRTSNGRESNPETATVPTMWKNFFEYNVTAAIPKQINPLVVYGVYYNYESGSTGDYDLLIGLQSGATEKPANLSLVEIKEGKYLVFKVPEASPESIKETWAAIEGYFETDTVYTRAFTTDFEVYRGKSDISIYIAVK